MVLSNFEGADFYNNYTVFWIDDYTPGQLLILPRLVIMILFPMVHSFPISANAEKADFLRLQNVLFSL